MSRTPFSLLLPVYHADDADHFERAFRSSVVEQTVRPDDVVIVQDGPVGEGLAAAIRRQADSSPVPVRVTRLNDNRGLALALEAGLDACAHDVVARIDADDVSLPTRFERQLEAIETGLDLVGTGMYEFEDDDDRVVGQRVPVRGAAEIDSYARFHDPFNHPTVMYRRSAVRAAGGYRPLGLMEDYWLFARMLQSGARCDNLVEPLVKYRIGSGAYVRRGGLDQFVAELRLQREFRRSRFTTTAQFARNVVVRGLYRFIPVRLRKVLYEKFIARGLRGSRPL